MFKTLLLKEWKDKAPIAAFGLALEAIFLAAYLIFAGNRDLRELIPGGFLILFPFIGLILGAGAFESEFRDGAWAYLLSRPVRKEKVWLAKLVALLSVLACLWLVFIGLMAVVPGLGDIVLGFKLGDVLESGLAFFPLILLSSLFFFSIAFSLSILTEKQLGLVLGCFLLGFVLESVLPFIAFLAEGRGMLTRAGRFIGLDVFVLALVLSSLAFLAASLVTFLKSDFSQPKVKAKALARWCLLFLAAAWALSAAWPALQPGPKEEFAGIEVAGNDAVLTTNRGLYRYDPSRDKLKRIIRWRSAYPHCVTGGGKVLYVLDRPEGPALWVADMNGSGKKLLAGGGGQEGTHVLWFQRIRLSPDGRTAVFLYEEVSETSARTHQMSLASIGTDGKGLKKLDLLDPGLAGAGEDYAWVGMLAWLESPDGILMAAGIRKDAKSRSGTVLWRYDLSSGAQTKLFESPVPAGFIPDPAGKSALSFSRRDLASPMEVSILDLATGTSMPVMTVEPPKGSLSRSIVSPVWNRDGDKVAFLIRQDDDLLAPAVYLLKERRLVSSDDVRVKESRELASLGWTPDGLKLMLADPSGRSLRILGPDLAWNTTIPVPASVGGEFTACPAGDAVLVSDYANVAVWRLDLKTEKWKKIW
jgi:ABC-type transport system involved in multi-copper enzyme maturation permease subunit